MNVTSKLRKQFCPKGHDKLVVGRTKDFGCQQCRQDYKNEWRRTHPEKFARARAQSRAWALRNPIRCRESNWKRQGIACTAEMYEEMLHAQEGRCKICGEHESTLRIPLAVDHNHMTGAVRGLLCRGCNAKLGVIEDAGFMEGALVYLKNENGLRGNRPDSSQVPTTVTQRPK
jgi:hypothetical protein